MARRKPPVHVDPEVMHGVPVFTGTRVPIESLLDHLEVGDSLELFLESFSSVRRSQAIEALKIAREAVLSTPRSA
jgi:uncharacterized protein (DUF433 family)